MSCATKAPPTSQEIKTKALPNATIPATFATPTTPTTPTTTADPADLATSGQVPSDWLKSFNDPTLESLVEEALKYNLDIRVAKSRLDAAAASAQAAGATLTPVVSASGSGLTQSNAEGVRATGRGAGLNISWELDVWGRLRQQAGAADAKYQGAALDFEYARQSIAAATAKAYFLASEAFQQQRLAEDQVASYVEMARVITARKNAGKLGEQDVRLVQADLAAARDRLASAEAAQKQVTRALETILGRYPSAELAAAPAFPAMPGPVPVGIPSEVLERRPDVAAAERRVKAAFMNVEAKKLARLPSIGLTGGAGTTSGLASLTGNGGFFNIGANFFAPIFDGGQRQADVKIATADQEQALAAYGQTALRAFKDVEDALTADTTLALRESLQQSAVTDTEEALRLRQIEANAGKADTLTVLQLKTKLDLAKSGLITLRQSRRSERINLHLALGGTFETPR
ncbi:MAG: efflux transporter outer membrane subunit [Tepidisphaera sp.]